MNQKIVIYSDFDGVFNISDSSANRTAVIETDGSSVLSGHSKIMWNDEVVKSMNDLLSTNIYDFVWHTTWNDGGNIIKAAEVMGMSNFVEHTEAILNTNANNKMEWTQWKAEYILEDQRKNPRPFIWIDDSAPYFWGDYIRGSFRDLPLIIHTNGRVGLSKRDIIKIIDWTQEKMK